jgi:hypothetical protein
MSSISDGWLPSRFDLDSADQFRVVTTIFGIGFAALSGLISALYFHAWRQREVLDMAPVEAFDTAAESLAWAIVTAFGPLSIALAWILPDGGLAIAVWLYCGLAVFGPLFDWLQRRAVARRYG